MTTRTGRQAKIAALVASAPVRSQAHLLELLRAEGIDITQATLSRDLDALGAHKAADESGEVRYVISDDGTGGRLTHGMNKMAKTLVELSANIDYSANIVVIRTPPGGAAYLASAIDRSGHSQILGTVAGDDTVLVVSRDPAGGQALAQEFRELAGGI